MKGLSWEDFRDAAEGTVCRGCQCGFARPWRGGPTCQHAWLRFSASCGLILTCNESRETSHAGRRGEGLMSEHAAHKQVGVD